jgi:hypothetical protein
MSGGTKSGVSTISLERLHCVRRDSSGHTERRRRRRINFILLHSGSKKQFTKKAKNLHKDILVPLAVAFTWC